MLITHSRPPSTYRHRISQLLFTSGEQCNPCVDCSTRVFNSCPNIGHSDNKHVVFPWYSLDNIALDIIDLMFASYIVLKHLR